MSDTETDSQADGEQVVAVTPVLTFPELFLLGINFWSIYAIIAIEIVGKTSYLNSNSFGSLVFGWVLLGATTIISWGLWRFLKRGRIRSGIAVVGFLLFNLFYFGGPLYSRYSPDWGSLKFSGGEEEVVSCPSSMGLRGY